MAESGVSSGWGGAVSTTHHPQLPIRKLVVAIVADSASRQWCAYGQMSREHDQEFYQEARKRRDEAIARGEDPYADFKAMVAKGGSESRLERAYRRVMDEKTDQEGSRQEMTTTLAKPQNQRRISEDSESSATKKKGAFRRLFSRRRRQTVDSFDDGY
ncbi:hypothetical protein F5Y15DRAFT_171065 [Xylariaceae sp. FL0016]|nr:hypothetical protein F5Y15DRAFT_171065 [Xylariaceae sp. FL0016]